MCPVPAVLPASAPLSHQLPPPSHLNERFYKFDSPSPPEQSSPVCYSDLEDSGFHSDEEIQKVRRGSGCERV